MPDDTAEYDASNDFVIEIDDPDVAVPRHRAEARCVETADTGETRSAPDGPPRPRLTAREREVVRAWLFENTKRAAGRRLFISVSTVDAHLTNVREKFRAAGRQVSTKTQLLARALEDDIVDLSEIP